ncbi:hypothetical protein [Streptomyces sp. WG7]|uniref:hypothetical protein n=1 Tax=Streptomyces sp. WG7 TaxID=3417650 RepID=UPI003CF512DB
MLFPPVRARFVGRGLRAVRAAYAPGPLVGVVGARRPVVSTAAPPPGHRDRAPGR